MGAEAPCAKERAGWKMMPKSKEHPRLKCYAIEINIMTKSCHRPVDFKYDNKNGGAAGRGGGGRTT